MVSFNGLTLPHVTQIKQQKTQTFYQVNVPNRAFDYRAYLGGQGDTFTVDGWLQSKDSTTRAQIEALSVTESAGGVYVLDLQEPFYQTVDAALRYQSGPTWTNDTAEAATGGGTAFTLPGATTDYFYIGSGEQFNLLSFVLSTMGSYATLTWQYSQGNGNWNTLTVTDGTNKFAQNGNITFTPPSDWKFDTVNSIANFFWVRVSAASVTTAATCLQILLNPCYQCMLFNPLFTMDPTIWDQTNYELTLYQVVNP